jgi:hypothetical protein
MMRHRYIIYILPLMLNCFGDPVPHVRSCLVCGCTRSVSDMHKAVTNARLLTILVLAQRVKAYTAAPLRAANVQHDTQHARSHGFPHTRLTGPSCY